MADPKYVNGSAGINLPDLISLLGGQNTTTTRSADTTALQGVLQQLQAVDPMAQLQTIFTQAAGQIPGLQARMSNAIGARSGGNSAVQAALQRLLQQTTLLGQQQVAAQQQQNLATQGQVAGQIAQANSSQRQQQGTNLGQAGRNLAILQGGAKILGSDAVKTGVGKAKNWFDDLFSSGSSGSQDVLTSTAGSDFMGPLMELSSASVPELPGGFDANGVDFSGIADFGSDLGGLFDFGGGSTSPDVGGIDWDLDFGYKHGGMVGRDKPSRIPRYKDGGRIEFVRDADGRMVPKVGSRSSVKESGGGNLGKDAVKSASDKKDEKPIDPDHGKNIFRATNDRRERAAGLGGNFADGGQVTLRSGGGRRTSAPSFTPDAILQSIANQGGMLRGQARTSMPQLQDPIIGSETEQATPETPGATLGSIIGNVLGLMSNPLGFVAHTMDQAIAQQNPTAVAPFAPMANAVTAVTNNNPMAMVQALLGFLGQTGKGQSDADAFSAPIGTTSTATSIGMSPATAAALGLAAPETFGPMSTNAAVADALSPAAAAINAAISESSSEGYAGYGSDGFGGAESGVSGGFGDAGSGAAGGDAAGGFGEGIGGGEGFGGEAKNGGEIVGPGTGTSDSINIKVSNGEYIVPADVVDKIGVGFFDSLRTHFHDFSEKQPSMPVNSRQGSGGR